MSNPGLRPRKQRDFLRIELDAMRMPHIRPGPAQIFGILPGPHPKFFQTIGNVFVIFRQMGVHHHPFVTGQERSIAHQFAADRKRRAGRHANPAHRARARIVKAIDDTDHVLENIGLPLDQTIWRQASGAFTYAHSPPCGVKSHTDLLRGVYRIFQPRAIGIEIQVI